MKRIIKDVLIWTGSLMVLLGEEYYRVWYHVHQNQGSVILKATTPDLARKDAIRWSYEQPKWKSGKIMRKFTPKRMGAWEKIKFYFRGK